MSKESTLTAEVEDKKAQRNIGDPVIWGIYISLVLISMVESFSASSQIIGTGAGMYAPIFKHAILLFGGFCALLVFYFTNYKNFPKLFTLLAAVTILALILAPIIGQDINGAKRAINLGFFSVQPAEMAKVSIVALIAWVTA